MKINIILYGLAALILFGCNTKDSEKDASGFFEAEEIIVSAESQGRINLLNVEEGQVLQAGEKVGSIDSLQLVLQKRQLEAQMVAILGKKPDIPVQLAALEEQIRTASKEKTRIESMLKGGAATPKQLDDINAQIGVLNKQLEAQKSALNLSSSGLNKEVTPLQIQVEQLDNLIRKSEIINPVQGTVLIKYASAFEMTAAGQPLYKIANLQLMNLRVYINGNQLPQVRLNQKVKVLTDDGKGGFHETEGEIVWISDKAEFTPKAIQTKEERDNKVYALKIKVQNDGTYKIGMYGEVRFE